MSPSKPNYLLIFLAPLQRWWNRCFAQHWEGGQSAPAAWCRSSGPRPRGLRLVSGEQAAKITKLPWDSFLLTWGCYQDWTQVKTIFRSLPMPDVGFENHIIREFYWLTVHYYLRLWNGVVPDRCRQLFKRGEEWKCFFGHRLYSTLTCECWLVSLFMMMFSI